MVSQREFVRANRAGKAKRATGPVAVAASFDRKRGLVVVRLSSGLEIGFPPHHTQALERAKPADLLDIEITPSGLGLHFPRIQEDIHLPSLLEGFFGSSAWMARRLGAQGGQARSKAKAAAARANGKLGGRPRKVA